MAKSLPPPDPHESHDPGAGLGPELSEPIAVFVNGPPDAEDERIADELLEVRPGLLILLAD